MNPKLFTCVLYPISKNKQIEKIEKKRYTAIIKKDDFFLQNERIIYDILKKEPNNNLYFYIFETLEQINYNEISEHQPALEYSSTIKNTDTYLVRYNDKTFLSFEDIKITCSNKIQFVRFIMNSYTKLLQSIDILLQYNIVHNNISSSSIGFDEIKEPFLFKFEFSMVLTQSNLNIEYLRKYFVTYKPTYYYWPLELHAFTYLLSNNLSTLSSVHTDKIIEEVITRNSFISKFGNNMKTMYEKQGIQYLSKFINKPLIYITNEIVKCYTSWDNYRLSILYLEIIAKHFVLSNKFIQNMIKLLLINVQPNPLLRLPISQTIHTFEEICYHTDVTDFKNIQLKS